VLARFERGELYDRRKVDDLREAMIATGPFTTVSAEPVRTGEAGPDGTEYVNILVRQDAGPARQLTGSAGYNTGEGLRIEAAWEHRNLFPPEGALRAAAVAGTQEQSVSLSFRRSNAGKRDRTVLALIEAGRRDYAAFRGYTARLSGLISRESTPIWQKRWTWAYGAELIATNEALGREPRLSLRDAYFLGGLTGQLGYDRSDSLLNPTKGFRLLGRTNPEISFRNANKPYVRNIVEGSAYYPAGDNLVIAGRARFGSIAGIARTSWRLPASLFRRRRIGSRLRLPGTRPASMCRIPNSIRRIPATPSRPSRIRSAAAGSANSRSKAAIVSELRGRRLHRCRLADREIHPGFSDMRFGIGVGGRLYTNFGPLRVDVATPLGRRRGESRIAMYISIGQAF
jgi:translocation and assembly module TamA